MITVHGLLSHRRMVVLWGMIAVAGMLLAVSCGKEKAAAPSFAGDILGGGTFDLSNSDGRPVLINFWYPSCPPCSAEIPDLQAAYEKYGDRVDFIGVQQVGLDTKQDGINFLQERGVTYPNIPDEKSSVQASYNIISFPTTVFLDRDHNINRTWQGLISPDQLDKQLEAVIDS